MPSDVLFNFRRAARPIRNVAFDERAVRVFVEPVGERLRGVSMSEQARENQIIQTILRRMLNGNPQA
jgi:hypothetical protein